MPEYKYTARDRAGKLASGTIVAEDDAELRHILRANDLFITEFKARQAAESGEAKRSFLSDWSLRPKLQDMVIATRQLASMIRAGVPLVGALEAIEGQTKKPALINAFREVRRAVTEGQPLSDAMRRHPSIFTPLVLALVSSGEISGELDIALDVAANQLDREVTIRRQIKTATAYPKIVVAASVGTVAAMLTFVVPVFADVYKQLHTQLPWITQMLVQVSAVVTRFWWLVLAVAIGGLLAYKNFRKTTEGRRATDRFWLKLPGFGPLWRKLVIARFVQTLAGGMRGGVPIVTALQVSASTAGNLVIEDAVLAASEKIREGASLAEELERSGEFPTMVTRMIAAGELSGNVDGSLDEINRFYERDVNDAMEKLTRLIEPLMTVILGAIVLVILAALYMPVFNIGKAISSYK